MQNSPLSVARPVASSCFSVWTLPKKISKPLPEETIYIAQVTETLAHRKNNNQQFSPSTFFSNARCSLLFHCRLLHTNVHTYIYVWSTCSGLVDAVRQGERLPLELRHVRQRRQWRPPTNSSLGQVCVCGCVGACVWLVGFRGVDNAGRRGVGVSSSSPF